MVILKTRQEGQGDPWGVPGKGSGHGQGHEAGGGGAMPEEVDRAVAPVSLLGGLLGGVPWGTHLDHHPGSLQGEDHGPAGQGSIPPPARDGGCGHKEAF